MELKVAPRLVDAIKGSVGKSGAAALAELLATLSRLAVTDQICSQLADLAALPLAITELGKHMTDAGVAKQACFFLASISGNDACKGSIVQGYGHVAIIQAMLLHPNNAGMQTACLRSLKPSRSTLATRACSQRARYACATWSAATRRTSSRCSSWAWRRRSVT